MPGMLLHFGFLWKLKLVPRDTPSVVLLLTAIVPLGLGWGTAARAQDEAAEAAPEPVAPPAEAAEPPGPEPSVLATTYPPPVAGPALRLPESPTRLWLDGAYADSKDLSALPYIAGRGRNVRVARGRGLSLGGLRFRGGDPVRQRDDHRRDERAEPAAVAGGRAPDRGLVRRRERGRRLVDGARRPRHARRRRRRCARESRATRRGSSSTSPTAASPTSRSPTTSTSSRPWSSAARSGGSCSSSTRARSPSWAPTATSRSSTSPFRASFSGTRTTR